MLCPCKCAGSMGAIHMLCLREWLANKRQVFEGARVTSFFWKLLECELCKEPFERKMRSTLFNILEFDLPDGQGIYKYGRGQNYMILESINSMPAKVVHVFNLRYDNFRAGRSIEADMKIADISVSRFHSYFRVVDQSVYVEDNGSKFGTLIKIQRPFNILSSREDNYSQSTLLQVGRSLLHLNFVNTSKYQIICQKNPSTVKSSSKGAYLRLRKDNMRIPREFFKPPEQWPDTDGLVTAIETKEVKEESARDCKSTTEEQNRPQIIEE